MLKLERSLEDMRVAGEHRSQEEVKQDGAEIRWDGLEIRRRETSSRPWEEQHESSGKEKSHRRILFLVSSWESSRNGDIPLKY